MAPLSNGRHEKFAQAIAAGKTQEKAYIAAGYSEVGARANASRLIANDSVKARIAELQRAGAKRAEITLESLLAEAAEIQQQAQAAGQLAAANAALKLKSELSGHYVARKEAKVETTTTPALTSVVAQLLGKGDGEVQIVPAVGSGTVVRFRESQDKKTYLVPTNIAEPYAILPEPLSSAEEWLAQYAPTPEAPTAPVPAPGSDKVN